MSPRVFLAGPGGACVAALSVVALLALLIPLRTPLDRVWGDEGTFLAMSESLVRDGDLLFDERDEERVVAHLEGLTDPQQRGRGSLILERTERGIAYSKPILYALLAAPFFALFGPAGLVVVNFLAFGLALAVAYLTLRRLESRDGLPTGRAAWTLVSFAFAAVLIPYLFWRMADLLQTSLALAGLMLVFGHGRGAAQTRGEREKSQGADAIKAHRFSRLLDSAAAPWVGTALVALTVPMRLSNLALAGIPVLAALLQGRWRTAVLRGLVVVLAIGSIVGLTFALTGAPDPYRAERTTFLPSIGYPAGIDQVEVEERFSRSPASHRAQVGGPREIAYAALYFLVGRHTGILFYFPAAFFLLLVALRKSDALGRAALLGFGVAVAFFVVVKPENYFGGETFLGNRYFLSLYPALLAAIPRLPSVNALRAIWGLAAISLVSAVISVVSFHDLDSRSQSHVHAGVFRALPYESTAQGLDGRRDRYWAGQMVRFVDPFATTTGKSFELEAGKPAAEIMVVSWQDPGRLRFEVEAEADEAEIRFGDWKSSQRYQVGRALAPEGGPVGIEIETSQPWRYHRFWFENQVYWARLIRLELDAEPGARARLRHLGDPEVTALSFAYELLQADLSGTAEAGGTSLLRLAVRNTSRNNWYHDDVVAVSARYRIWQGAEKVGESERISMPDRIAPGEVLNLDLPIRWPEVEGQVELEVDLVLERVAWFQDRLGQPLLRRPVVLAPAGNSRAEEVGAEEAGAEDGDAGASPPG